MKEGHQNGPNSSREELEGLRAEMYSLQVKEDEKEDFKYDESPKFNRNGATILSFANE